MRSFTWQTQHVVGLEQKIMHCLLTPDNKFPFAKINCGEKYCF